MRYIGNTDRCTCVSASLKRGSHDSDQFMYDCQKWREGIRPVSCFPLRSHGWDYYRGYRIDRPDEGDCREVYRPDLWFCLVRWFLKGKEFCFWKSSLWLYLFSRCRWGAWWRESWEIQAFKGKSDAGGGNCADVLWKPACKRHSL